MADTDRRLIGALRAFVPEVMRVNATPGLNLAVGRGGLTDAMIARMAKPFGAAADDFDVDAFTPAVDAILSTDRTVGGIHAFTRSPECPLAPEELPLLYRDLGGLGPFPVPATVGLLPEPE